MRHTDEEYAYWLNTDEEDCWFDRKEKNVRFPEYKDDQSSEVHIWNLNDIK
ncbi:hypothetical protein [Sporosarcina globispora]|uniref:hypothetical protein n=1 Tax=Sporosarcina globispora TaxID=1459 RepID=UPI000A646E24|nr:hypothetical protein [Sporosarcina globispora]